jgi:hypothetical protein
MFELFQDVVDYSVAFHLCEQTPSFPTLYFSLARCSRMRLRWHPAERGSAGAGRSSAGLTGELLSGTISTALSWRSGDRCGRPCLAGFLESFRVQAEIPIWTNGIGILD